MIFYNKISYINCNKQTVNEAFTSFQRKCKRLLLSVNLEKACVTLFNMYHVTKNTGLDEIKGEYSLSHASR